MGLYTRFSCNSFFDRHNRYIDDIDVDIGVVSSSVAHREYEADTGEVAAWYCQ